MTHIKSYKIKLTDRDRANIEKTLLETSTVYKWLKEAGYSKNALFKGLNIGRFDYVQETFRFPEKYITLEKLKLISDMLPEKSIKDILVNIMPEYTKAWYELEAHELDQLERKLTTPNEKKKSN